MLLFYIISGVLTFFLLLPFLTVVAGQFAKKNTKPSIPKNKTLVNYDFANIITAYKNADIAKPLVASLIRQGHKNHHIYLVADGANLYNWDIYHSKVTVLRPDEALNLKVKSIIHATENFVRPHDYTIIWDADNLAHPHFLAEINSWANAGKKAIQGQRTAKNLNNQMAAADSLGEFYKNYIERLVPPRLGSSTVISGSGMAVETKLYNTYLYGKEIQEGQHLWKKMMQEDKILQNHVLRAGERIVYAKDAICYDEKVSNAGQVETQRSRWLFSYFQNLPNSTSFVLRGLTGFNWNKFLFGLITVSPPLFILVGLSGLCFILGLFFNISISLIIAASMSIFILNIFWTLYLSNAPQEVYYSILAIPSFIFRQFLALFKMVNPNKNFVHSEHTAKVSIDDVVK